MHNISNENITLKNFKIIKEIYNNDMSNSILYLTYYNNSEKVYILKEIRNNKFIKNFNNNEFTVLCSFNHDNIIKGYLHFFENNSYYCLMEYLENGDYLEDKILVNLDPIKSDIKLKSYISDLVNGLKEIHNNRYIHSDIKIENIATKFIKGKKIPTLKIIDFGLAKKVDDNGCYYVTTIFGTKQYMAPEIKKGNTISNKIDIFSLGIVIYLFVTCYTPYDIGYRLGDKPIFRDQDWENINNTLKDLVKRMLDPNPSTRIAINDILKHSFFI